MKRRREEEKRDEGKEEEEAEEGKEGKEEEEAVVVREKQWLQLLPWAIVRYNAETRFFFTHFPSNSCGHFTLRIMDR